MVSCSSLIAPLILSGDLHTARFVALNYSLSFNHSRVFTAKAAECARAWSYYMDELLLIGDNALQKIDSSHRRYGTSYAIPFSVVNQSTANRVVDDYFFDLATWEKCCRRSKVGLSSHQKNPKATAVACNPDSFGCVIGAGSEAALLLPLIDELLVRIWLPPPTGRVLTIEQDGILQPHGVPTMLWPGGYLLTLFMNDLFGRPYCHFNYCHNNPSLSMLSSLDDWFETFWKSRHRPLRILELGAGVGAPSIAAALAAAAAHVNVTILATDRSRASLALTTANIALNGVYRSSHNQNTTNIRSSSSSIGTHLLDFANRTSRTELLTSFPEESPFDLVIGASLQFEEWKDQFYDVMEDLTRDDGLVVLVHSTGDLDKPSLQSSFDELGRISGKNYCMHHHETSDKIEVESCFELIIWRKRRKRQELTEF